MEVEPVLRRSERNRTGYLQTLRVPYTRHYTAKNGLRALGKVMTSPPLVASKHTCYKLVTSFSTRARINQLERVFVCIYTCITL